MAAEQFEKSLSNYLRHFTFILFVLCISAAALVGCGHSQVTSHNEAPAKLIITAFKDDNNNKQKDVGEAGVPGILFDVGGPVVFGAKTGQNGTIVREVKPGSYRIRENSVKNWFSITETNKSLSLNPGETKQIDFGLVGPQYIVAFFDSNANGKLDEGEYRLVDWKFDINGLARSTDTNGQISLNNLPAGKYNISEDLSNPELYNTTASIVNVSVPGRDIYFGMAIVQDTLIKEILAVHNRHRAEVNVPPLTWSNILAVHAQSWADHLASQGGALVHAPQKGEGENLASGTGRWWNFTQLADLWSNEKKDFTNGTFPDVSSTRNWKDVGHYTQMIWQDTAHVGCGVSYAGGGDILVCRYSPPGNWRGQAVYRTRRTT
jgi:hypothetical protein